MWIFGYGSLVWRPSIPFVERLPGTIRGWSRRFWQGSPDHRGVPGRPGRVVTLIPEPRAACWGVGYRIEAGAVEDVLAALDHREQAGYERIAAPLELSDGRVVDATTYVAGPTNPDYLGPAPEAAIAAHARLSHGPSGPNREYVLELARALRAIGADDPHVFAIAELLA